MDGFESDAAVIVLGATNRPEVLDPALLRPGRFDRRVAVPPPDKEGRAQILEVHTRSLPLDDDVDLDRLAATTPGMVGADLANLANEAALTAARRNHEKVKHAPTSPTRWRRSSSARRAAMVLSGRGPPPHRLPRGGPRDRRHAHARAPTRCARSRSSRAAMALGVTLSRARGRPVELRGSTTCWAKIKVALGGRVAEEVVFGTITTGAESDIQQLTADRAPDGRPLGHERGDRPDRRAARRRPAARCCRAPREVSERTQQTRRRGGPADRRRGPRRGDAQLLTENRDQLDGAEPRRCSRARRSTRPPPTRPRASRASVATPAMRPARSRRSRPPDNGAPQLWRAGTGFEPCVPYRPRWAGPGRGVRVRARCGPVARRPHRPCAARPGPREPLPAHDLRRAARAALRRRPPAGAHARRDRLARRHLGARRRRLAWRRPVSRPQEGPALRRDRSGELRLARLRPDRRPRPAPAA